MDYLHQYNNEIKTFTHSPFSGSTLGFKYFGSLGNQIQPSFVLMDKLISSVVTS